ncbi:hypothetical protein CR513_45092, partial [Mucuna pruriens]
MFNTPLPAKHVEGDEEALETPFQALEIVGTTNAEIEGGDLRHLEPQSWKPNNSFQPGKGLGKKLDGMTEPVVLQENLGLSGLGYMGTTKKERLGQKTQSAQWKQPSLYRYFTSEGIISPNQIVVIEDQRPKLAEWVHLMAQELDNWTSEALLDLVTQQM